MLQIQPEEDIVLEFINQDHVKYLRALGLIYFRMTCPKHDKIFRILESKQNDFRRMIEKVEIEYKVLHMDEFIDRLLHDERVLGVQMPRISKRHVLVEDEDLESYVSKFELEEDDESDNSEPTTMQNKIANKYGDSSSNGSDNYKKPLKKRDVKAVKKESKIEKLDPNADDYWIKLR